MESQGALAYSVLNPQLENSKLIDDDEEERKNKSLCMNNEDTVHNQFSAYNLILQETLLENSMFFEKLKRETEDESDDDYKKEQENVSEKEEEEENEENDEKEEKEKEQESPILRAYESEIIEKVEIPEDPPESREVEVKVNQSKEVKNFFGTIEYSPEKLETHKANKKRYRSAPRQARNSITEGDDDDESPVPRGDLSFVHDLKPRMKASQEIPKTAEPEIVEPKPVNESTEVVSTLAVTMPVPVTVNKPVIVMSNTMAMPNNQRNNNNNNRQAPVRARPKVFLNESAKQDLNRSKKLGAESSQKLILPTKKPPVPRCVSVPRKPVAVNMSQNFEESLNRGN